MKFPFSRFTIHGSSMFPALKQGQDVLIWCWFYEPKVGDMVVIKNKGLEKIKRIKKVYKDKIFVEGDNKKESTDSRDFGAILRAEIVGKVVYVR